MLWCDERPLDLETKSYSSKYIAECCILCIQHKLYVHMQMKVSLETLEDNTVHLQKGGKEGPILSKWTVFIGFRLSYSFFPFSADNIPPLQMPQGSKIHCGHQEINSDTNVKC